ncbi:LytTR family DNA-binding domain-containing protein [soil metagenome]
MKKINCIIIDDEPLACKGLKEYIEDMEMLNLLAVVNHASDAIDYLPDTDLMYLDINMPKISGIDFLQQVKNPPLTIITTAYQQYALQSYELDVMDYLLKPISFPRFFKATNKAIEYLKLLKSDKQDLAAVQEYFFVKSNGVLEKIQLNEVLAVEALSNYIIIHCTDKKIITYLTLKQINEYLPVGFIKVHKSFIVSISKIEKIDHDEIIVQHLKIPIGSLYKEDMMIQVINGKLLKR